MKKIWVGHARDDSAARVYGFFNSGGRFCCRVVGEQSDVEWGRRSYGHKISHDEITYDPIFQHKTYEMVRIEARKQLVRVLGSVVDGEI